MDQAHTELVQVIDARGVSTLNVVVGGTPVVGVDTITMSGDEKGAYIDVRLRVFTMRTDGPKPDDNMEVKID